jgi:hypothetical protein
MNNPEFTTDVQRLLNHLVSIQSNNDPEWLGVLVACFNQTLGAMGERRCVRWDEDGSSKLA